ncbi:MAG TPA: hypothetical protein VFH54_05745 [Mycobacteriales bacterium]|nr:hypothetical protein [Mycobacteriales bacterium]
MARGWVITAIVLFLLGAWLTYWVVRLAVTHGMRDALRVDLVRKAELEDAAETAI